MVKVKLSITVLVASLVFAPATVAAGRVSRSSDRKARHASRHAGSARRVSRPGAKGHRITGPEASVTLTTPDLRKALSPMPAIPFTRVNPNVSTIDVSDATRYQTVTGFGAAMTDASAWLLYDELPVDIRNLVMASL